MEKIIATVGNDVVGVAFYKTRNIHVRFRTGNIRYTVLDLLPPYSYTGSKQILEGVMV